jgi:integrase
MTVEKEGKAWYMRFMIRGKRYHEPTGARTKAGALKAEAERRLQLIEGEDPRLRKAPTLEEFSKEFLKFIEQTKAMEPNTKRSYTNGWRLLAKTQIIHRRMDAIYPSNVDMLTFPGSGSNANQALRTLQRMLSLAVERRYLAAAPSIKLREENRRKATLTDLWMEELLLRLASPILRDFMVIMLDAGPRPEEVARMQRSDILWSDHAIHIPKGKTEKAERFVPLSERMADLLRDRLAGHKSEWVFASRIVGVSESRERAAALAAKGATPSDIARALGVSWPTAKNYLQPPNKIGTASESGHVSPTSVGGKMWRELMADAAGEIERRGLPSLPEGLVLYSCRHTFASRFLKASGNDRAALKEILGHSSFAISERYVHPGIADAAQVMDKFNEGWRKLRAIGRRA